MRFNSIKLVAALILGIMLGPPASAQTPGQNQASALLALAKAKREREELARHLAVAAAAARTADMARASHCYDDIDAAAAAAASSERPLVVWVGIGCADSPAAKATLAEMPDVVHVHQKIFRGDASPRIVFTDPAGKDWALDKADLGKAEAIREIRTKLNLPALARGK